MPAHIEYRVRWERAGYRSGMGSALACVPPADPNLIRVYHLTSSQFAISNIALGRLKVARFSDLNDPFELLALNFRELTTRKVVRDFKDGYDAHTGVLCFSADWIEPVLWSHYAEKHRGICLGFDVPREELQQVKYEADRVLAKLDIDPNPSNIAADLQNLLLCTKSKGWSYEDEYRRFIPLSTATAEGHLYFVPFGPAMALAEVILGPLCETSVDAVRQLVRRSKYPHAVVYKSRLAFKYFNVVPDERTIP